MTGLDALWAFVLDTPRDLALALKATAILGAMLASVRLARRQRAAVRSLVLACGFGVLLLLPPAAVVLPSIVIEIPYDAESTRAPAPEALQFAVDGETAVRAVGSTSAGQAAVGGPGSSVVLGPGLPGAFPWTWALRIVWLVVMSACLIPVAAALQRVRTLRHTAVPWPEGETLARDIVQAAGMRRMIPVLLGDRAAVPMISGVLRPAIVLPADARAWSDADVRRALLHEIEHIRRADFPVFIAARVVCAMYWFHPAVWMAWRRLHLEAERACDDAVLRHAERSEYARQLVALADRLQSRDPDPVPAMAVGGDLSARVRAVLDPHQRRGRTGARWTGGSGAVASAVLLAIAPLSCQGTAGQDPRPGGTPYTVSIRENAFGPVVFPPDSPLQSPRGPFVFPPGMRLPQRGFRVLAGRFVAEHMSVSDLLAFAYDLSPWYRDRVVAGWPEDVGAKTFDVTVSVQDVVPPVPLEERRRIVGAVLEDRFDLETHVETRPMPVLALTLTGEGPGPGLQRLPYDCASYWSPRRAPDTLPDGVCLRGWDLSPPVLGNVGSGNLARLAEDIQKYFDRLVVDGTGLEGTYMWTIAAPRVGPDMGGEIRSGLPAQLGLTLESHDDWPVAVRVIDSVSMPTLD